MATNGNVNHPDQYAAPAQTDAPAHAETSNAPLPKDEVGWYFVEQYYTTLAKSPERLHLFYGKKSQFVSGREAEVVPVSLGRQAIQERIKGLEFQDCKVRISNVDTQGSDDNILIQVIGEIGKGESKKFVQTFVLAQQPSGYFVLNDILRYIDEDVEEAPAEEPASSLEPPAPVEAETKSETPAPEEFSQEKEAAPLDAAAITEKLEDAAVEPPAAEEAAAEETPAAEPAAKEETAAAEETPAQTDVEKTVEEIAEEEVKKPEEPKDPAPTPAAVPAPVRAPAPAPAPAQPEKPKEPPKPMSWASRVAASGPRPVAPVVPKTATPPAPAQPRAPVPAAAQQAAPAQKQEAAPAAAAPKDQGSEWQTAETKRQSRAQPALSAPTEKEGILAYIKYVTDKVQEEDLKAALSRFSELSYFDINRQKNCAFVEFKTQAGYQAAIAANPHVVNGENVIVEQRRPKANAYGGTNYNAARGGPSRGGRGGFESRSGSQGGGRGGFTGQSRGGRGAPRGRGVSQVGTA
ncbi:hypothetical protein VTI74DRAFT_7712 [Chaetomium olivicolor]